MTYALYRSRDHVPMATHRERAPLDAKALLWCAMGTPCYVAPGAQPKPDPRGHAGIGEFPRHACDGRLRERLRTAAMGL